MTSEYRILDASLHSHTHTQRLTYTGLMRCHIHRNGHTRAHTHSHASIHVHSFLYIHAVHLLCGPLKTRCPVESHKALLDHLFLLQKSLLINKKRQRAKAGVNNLTTIVPLYRWCIFLFYECVDSLSMYVRTWCLHCVDIEQSQWRILRCVHIVALHVSTTSPPASNVTITCPLTVKLS